DNAGDILGEAAGEGEDRALSSVSYTLAAGVSVETLSTANSVGVEAIDLTGNEFDNNVYGNFGNNRLYGSAGADTLIAHAGDDWLEGGAGADRLFGGLGNDLHFVDNAGDVLGEASGQGDDRV